MTFLPKIKAPLATDGGVMGPTISENEVLI